MPRRNSRVLRVFVAVTIALLGGWWAVRPFLFPPQGLHPTGWTYSQLVRDRYPVHLISPTWLGDEISWSLAESATRLVVVAGGIFSLLVLARFARNEKRA